jgi:imidazolonepropionase-like amidohydrolase
LLKISAVASVALATSALAHEEQAKRGIPAASSTALDTGATPSRAAGEGAGPFRRLVIRGATLIDGTGSVPRGPVDIVVEGNRIADIRQAGWPGLPLKANREPQGADQEIDATGMYVLPGFVDTHTHLPGKDKAPDASYAYKLWLAHGVTTVRGVPLGAPAFVSSEKRRSASNEIAAPRIFNYQTLGAGWSGGRISSPEKAREWVRWAAKNDIDGIKFFGREDETAEVMTAAIDEAHKNKMGTVAHLSQTGVSNFNGIIAGRAHLDTITHFYGHMESLLKDHTIQKFSPEYNFYNELQRFGEVANIKDEVYRPGSSEWWDYLHEQKANNVNFDPTFNIYAASRDLMRARNADWQGKYTTPQLWNYFQSTRDNHGSYFFDWTSQIETNWKGFYQDFFRLIHDYNQIGGRTTVGTDSGFIYKVYGFAYIEELELFQEAGLTPLEIFRSATVNGAKTLMEPKGLEPEFGAVRRGMLADLVIVPENPLNNLKTLYGTGYVRLNSATNKQERVGGVRYTIKDGIVYDAPKLLAEVATMVEQEKQLVPTPVAPPVIPLQPLFATAPHGPVAQ